MCDFRRKHANREKIQLMDISGNVFYKDTDKSNEGEELDFLIGDLSLEKHGSSHTLCIVVAGSEVNEDFTVTMQVKIPTKMCPNCGKILK